jgi:hypothetical protein
VPDDEDADADHKNAKPAQGRDGFSQQKIAKQGNHGVGERRGWLNVAVVRPGENEHVGDEEGEQASDSEPNVTGSDDADKHVQKVAYLPVFGGTDSLHAFTEQDVAKGGEQDDEKDKSVGFQVQARGIFHKCGQDLSYRMLDGDHSLALRNGSFFAMIFR